jgi:hypothetical protein
MPELYVGNVSKQINQFAYRALERPGIVVQPIPIGGQIRISPNGSRIDLSAHEIDYILDQHRGYGLVSVDEINNLGANSGLCYSIGKPITVEKLQKAMRKKEDMLLEQGKKHRQEAALAVNAQIEEQIGAPLRQLEMSFAEEEPRAGYADDVDHIAEGVRVTRVAEGTVSIEQGRRRSR